MPRRSPLALPGLVLPGFVFMSLALCASCGPSQSGRSAPRSVLIITLDTTRADALTCLGAASGITPNLDALAQEGVLYESARTVTPITLPSHASMFTGLYPPRHTVRVNSVNALPESANTLAEAARADGLETAAFVASIVLAKPFGLGQGFERYDQPPPPPPGIQMPGQANRRPGVDVAAGFVSWFWGRDPSRPFFAWVHLYDPHYPYDPGNPHRAKDPGDGYLAEVAAADLAVGRLVEALEQREVLDETLIIVIADHGEGRGEHGEKTHSALIYESTMRVPMIVHHHDGYRAGERSDEIVSVVDVYPTVIDALGLKGEADIDGVSLYGTRVDPERGVYMESLYGFTSFNWSPLAAWADRESKYIHSSSPELYDVKADPGELDNRIAGASVERYRSGIDAVLRRASLERDDGDLAAQSLVAQLQQLGYTGAAPTETGAAVLMDNDLPSPVTRMDAYRRFLTTEDRSSREALERSVTTLQGILAENPANHSGWLQLSSALLDLRRYEEGLVAAQKAIELGREWYAPVLNLALGNDALERYDDAVAHYERAVELAPGLTSAIRRLVEIHSAFERPERAKIYADMLSGSR